MASFLIVGIGIAVVLLLIIQFRVNAFLALIAAAAVAPSRALLLRRGCRAKFLALPDIAAVAYLLLFLLVNILEVVVEAFNAASYICRCRAMSCC